MDHKEILVDLVTTDTIIPIGGSGGGGGGAGGAGGSVPHPGAQNGSSTGGNGGKWVTQ